MKMKKENINWIIIILWLGIVVVILINILNILNFLSWEENNDLNSSWVVLITTWVKIENNTWCIETSKPWVPQDFIDYMLSCWQEGTDFFIVYPEKQPNIKGNTREENNETLRSYAYNYKYSVPIWNLSQGWYILIVTDKPVSENRSLFIALDWSSKWALSKRYEIESYYENEYLYDMNKLYAWWYKIDFNRYIKDGKIIIGAYIWEPENYIKKIIIVKK